MGKSLMSCFLTHGVVSSLSNQNIWGLALPFLSSLSSSLSFSLEVGPLNTARGSGGALHAPQWGLWQSPSGNRILCILAL